MPYPAAVLHQTPCLGDEGGVTGSKFLAVSEMPWRPFDDAPGVAFRVLKTHKPGTGVTLMLRFDAGAAYPAHRHPAGEEYYVLAGELTDGARKYGAGTYVYHPPGSIHAPRSGPGAEILVFLPEGIERV
jgi:quercetin dioxygenase-like cupin family protein